MTIVTSTVIIKVIDLISYLFTEHRYSIFDSRVHFQTALLLVLLCFMSPGHVFAPDNLHQSKDV